MGGMHLDLSGKTALVTGSTQGIGEAIAAALARAGARTAVNGRKPDVVDEAVARLRAVVPGADVVGVAADVSTAEGAAALASARRAVRLRRLLLVATRRAERQEAARPATPAR